MKKYSLLLTIILLSAGMINAQDWVFAKQFASIGSVDNGQNSMDIKVDGNGDIYIVGNYLEELTIGGLAALPYSDLSSKEDIFLCKFDPSGNALWAKQIASNKRDLVGGIAIDANNNVYVVGGFMGTTLTFQGEATTLTNSDDGKHDAFLAKYDGSGSLIFADTVFYGTNVQRLLDITYDYTKDLLVTVGQFQGELRYDSLGEKFLPVVNTKNHILARFDLDGNFVDKVIFIGDHTRTTFKNVNRCVIADTVNSYFVTGDMAKSLFNASNTLLFTSADAVNSDIMVIKTNDKLVYQWGRKGGGTVNDHINSSGSDAFGNIYFTGKAESLSIIIDENGTTSTGPITGPGGQDYLLGKYSRDGNLQWIKRDGGPYTDNAYGLSVRNKRLLFTGNIDDNLANTSSGFAVYDLNGNLIAKDEITGDGAESGLNVVFDLAGDSTFVIGTFDGDSMKAGPSLRLNNTTPGVTDGFFVKYGYKFRVYEVDKTNVLCYGGSTGSIEVASEFGTPPITYVWTPNVSSTNIATGLSAGTYEIIATGTGGRKDTIEITLTQPADLATSLASMTPTSCNTEATSGNKTNGAVDINVIGGTSGFTYLWSPSGKTTQDISGVGEGEHIVTITDANSCVEVDTFIITEPSKVGHGGSIVDTIKVATVSSPGAVHLNTYGGTSAYTFSWTGPPGFIPSTEDTIKNLNYAGNYPLQVTDAALCVFDTVFNVPVDTGLTCIIDSLRDVVCKDDENGYARVAVILGGSGSYSYAWRKSIGTGVGINDDELKNVPAGSYIAKVTDLINGKVCDENLAEIDEPISLLNPRVDSTWDESCSNLTDGAIFTTVSGGWGGYSYLWTPGNKVTQDITNLAHGLYSVTVTDAGGCEKQLTDIPVLEPTPLAVSIGIHQEISCNSTGTGALVAHATGGTPEYSYLWNDPGAQIDSIARDLFAGTYRVDVTDGKGCATFKSATLTEPSVLMIDTAMVTNPGFSVLSDGSVKITASGGTRPYMYALNNGIFLADSVFTGLSVGTDTVWVHDANACGPVSKIITLSAPDPDPISLTDTSITNVLCKGDNTGAICVTPDGGVGVYYYSWTGTAITDSCITGLAAGMHEVEISDHISDTVTFMLEVSEPLVLLSVTQDSVWQISCNGLTDGGIFVTAGGGTTPYSYAWTGSGGYTGISQDITGLGPENFSLLVTDFNGCTVPLGPISIIEPPALKFDSVVIVHPTTEISTDGSITVYPGGGALSYIYSFESGAYTDSRDTTGLLAGDYSIRVKDVNGCGPIDTTVTLVRQNVSFGTISAGNIAIYPNPSSGKFTIEMENAEGKDVMLEIVNITGQLVYKKLHKYNGNSRFIERIDLSEQAGGSYFLRVNGLPIKTKLMIQ